MSEHQQDNPYAAPAVVKPDGMAPASGSGGPRIVDIAKRNIVGMLLTAIGLGVFVFAHAAFSKIFQDYKLDLPVITRSLENDWLVYGVPALLLATFLAGLSAKTRKRSAAIGTLGLIGLAFASLYVVVALLLPMVRLIESIGP